MFVLRTLVRITDILPPHTAERKNVALAQTGMTI